MPKCPKCGQDHHKALVCIGAKGGEGNRGKKASPAKREAAIKANKARWKDHKKEDYQ
jgi:hypothetical protein